MINNTTSTAGERFVHNDYLGAIAFIAVVLLWYASSFAFLLKMQTGTSMDIFDTTRAHPKKTFVQSLRDQTNNTKILKELVDKEKRDKLWDIYLGDSHDRITQAETRRIQNIEKQLASIDPYRRDSVQQILDNDFREYLDSDARSSDMEASSLNFRLRTRRRASLDHQILRQWKSLAEESKSNEYWPWAIQRLFIRRHLRRQRYVTDIGLTS
ncbi:unnamed protein product [Adineta ricciae]|uniref:Uncharacterized protein n=1 Tax=Adineta ricciae TaxID=249248 RepID=A0A815D042_ADIRI|nr:unnamed protein product [Adineta ricciae]